MLFTRTFMLSSLALLATADSSTSSTPSKTITLSPAQSTEVARDLANYFRSLSTVPGYSAAISVLSTALPESVSSEIVNDPSAYFQSIATETAQPSWLTAMPTSAQAFFSSVGAAEVSIVTKDAAGPAPTNAVKVAGAVLAAGGAALAML